MRVAPSSGLFAHRRFPVEIGCWPNPERPFSQPSAAASANSTFFAHSDWRSGLRPRWSLGEEPFFLGAKKEAKKPGMNKEKRLTRRQR